MALSITGKIKAWVDAGAKRIFKNVSKNAVQTARVTANFMKQQALNIIVNHEVSRDLRSHAQSKYLSGRKGTLFGFLGFDSGTDPVGDLVAFLENALEPEIKPVFGLLGGAVKISFPKITPNHLISAGLVLPWQKSIAWPYAIEENISNLPYFISINKGRSGEGLQMYKMIPGVTEEFHGVEYMTDLYKQMRKILRARRIKI